MTTTPRLPVAVTAAALLVAVQLVGAATARADGDPSVPPGTETTAAAPVKIDPNDPDHSADDD